VQTIVANRGAPPAEVQTPPGPTIQESSGRAGPVRTYQDLLKDQHDEDLFNYYCASQMALVDVTCEKVTPVGPPALYASVDISPDGQHLLIVRTERPYSYVVPASRFPKTVEVCDIAGNHEFTLTRQPLADRIPIDGVPTGPRNENWIPTQPATLIWTEALDEGDPKQKVPHRDCLFTLAAPFQIKPTELTKTQHRFSGISWGEKGLALVRDYDRDRRWTRTFALNTNQLAQPPRLLWERSVNDHYNDPGTPLLRPLPTGRRIIWQSGDHIFLDGEGATPRGDRPFLARYNLVTGQTDRLFQCDDASYESVVALLADDASQFITRHESPTDPPNYFVRTTAGQRRQLTEFPDPMPALRQIKKQLVTYNRADGVNLSFTLYLPPDHKPGQALPTIVWAYPREYNDADTAGQVSGSTNRFTTFSGISHLFLLTQGYAILDAATMPVIGDPETANNTYIEQIVASARAAIDKAVEMGVTDRRRVGVGGHSYGAFMTANLLAHSDLFRAGVARSGAYNRTLTPFGFQSERRTLWEAPEIYLQMSPLMVANKINEPILLIHGEADNNAGTFPIQSERLYHAIRGNGGIVRYVTLPHESHAYAARESIEHTLYEMAAWFDKHVKHYGQ
jgi:dipeptidyl aminopeptidase/acylaminoacyl peptidase